MYETGPRRAVRDEPTANSPWVQAYAIWMLWDTVDTPLWVVSTAKHGGGAWTRTTDLRIMRPSL